MTRGVRVLLMLIAALSVLYGLVFLAMPGFFVDLSAARPINLGWLRNVGAALVAVQGLGTVFAIRGPGNQDLLLVLGIASLAETLALGISLAAGEFSAARLWMVWGPAIAAGLSGMVYLLAVYQLNEIAGPDPFLGDRG